MESLTPYPLIPTPCYHNTPTNPPRPLSPTARASLTVHRLPASSNSPHRRLSTTSTTTLTTSSSRSSREEAATLFQPSLSSLGLPPAAVLPSRRSSTSSSTAPTLVHSVTSSTSTTTRPFTPVPTAKDQQAHADFLASLFDADALIRGYVLSAWEQHAEYVTVDSHLPMAGLVAIGRMGREDGVRACRGLVRVPVVHEEVVAGLWEFLVGYVEGGVEVRGLEAMEGPVGEANEGWEKTGVWVDELLAVNSRREKDEAADHKPKKGMACLTAFLRQCQHWVRHHRAREEHAAAPRNSTRCPFCSGHCADFCAPEPTTAGEGDNGFWQREEPVLSKGGSDMANGRRGRKRAALAALGRRFFLCGAGKGE
ncbi:hypothetical protein C8A05DRAFT_35447 [Staphylotrichum tortipilum]|uniref:Uncharacterized protein n=1 Tax=Staphylotrichum tortipilum TaxID=2831512 RepID=A0AAN6MIT6_9PEZI|nr:hypothetical protein C8A05DRAFT_35447 [Staphylotrichum longicolle]